MNERCRLRCAESRVTVVDDFLQVPGGNLRRRDVKRENLKGEVGEVQVLPALPVAGFRDSVGDVEAAIGGETLEDDFLEGKLPEKGNVSTNL